MLVELFGENTGDATPAADAGAAAGEEFRTVFPHRRSSRVAVEGYEAVLLQ